MMNKKYVLYILNVWLLLLFISCCSFSPAQKKDKDLFSDFEPHEWKDKYIFGATQYPPEIVVWNSQTRALEYKYSFFKAKDAESFFKNGGRWITIQKMLIVNKSIYCLAFGNQFSLVKIDVETGKLIFIDLKQRYDYMEYIPEANNGNGALLIVPYAQYMQDFNILLLDLEGDLLQSYFVEAADIDILSANGHCKNGCYYFCAGSHKNNNSITPSDGTYKIIKINLSSEESEIIPLETHQLIENDFLINNMPTLDIENYITSFSVKPGFSDANKYLISVDFIGKDVGRFLFETKDLSERMFSYTENKIIYSEDNIKLFPRMYFQIGNQYSMIGNYGDDLYSIIFNTEKKKKCYLPDSEVIFMDVKEHNIWCAKNSYYYSDEKNEWIYDGEGIYKVDLESQKVSLYKSDGEIIELETK